jgi:hypothetical protein
MAFVGLVEDKVRDKARHAPTVGILLCTGRNEAVVRYTLANMSAALGVASYEGLPAETRAALPSAEELGSVVREELDRQKGLHARGARPAGDAEGGSK